MVELVCVLVVEVLLLLLLLFCPSQTHISFVLLTRHQECICQLSFGEIIRERDRGGRALLVAHKQICIGFKGYGILDSKFTKGFIYRSHCTDTYNESLQMIRLPIDFHFGICSNAIFISIIA